MKHYFYLKKYILLYLWCSLRISLHRGYVGGGGGTNGPFGKKLPFPPLIISAGKVWSVRFYYFTNLSLHCWFVIDHWRGSGNRSWTGVQIQQAGRESGMPGHRWSGKPRDGDYDHGKRRRGGRLQMRRVQKGPGERRARAGERALGSGGYSN